MSLIRKPTTEAMVAANRANSLQCTGPVTDAGKLNARLNALKHGLTERAAGLCIAELGEQQEDLKNLRRQLERRFQPYDEHELSLVQRMVENRWRLRRVLRAEAGILTAQSVSFELEYGRKLAGEGRSSASIGEAGFAAAFGLALSPTLWRPAYAEVRYADVAGYSIEVDWTDSPVFRRPDGRTGSKDRTFHETLYLGARNHIFERRTIDQSDTGAFGGKNLKVHRAVRADTRKSEDVNALGELNKGAQWTFEAGALVKMQQFPEGAQRLVIDLAGAGDAFTCSLKITDLRKNGVGKIVLANGSQVEVVSRTVSVNYCKVEKGNLISGEN